MSKVSSNKRIAKNTLVLYIKLLISILINFISARLVLQALGASDYGLYNVVGGIVAMLNILGTAMIATSYRYMTVEIGKGENGNPNRMYNTVLVVHIIIAILLLIVGETLGLYYVNNYLNVPSDKIADATFVLHFSLIATVFSVISIPANGLIIAREKFVFTSIISIITDLLKLGVVVVLLYYWGNRLRLYALVLAAVHMITPIAYQVYCMKSDFRVICWNFNKNISDYKNILSFAWWIFIGACASIARTQGAAMIINFFFGTLLNAAFGLATQIFNATSQFTTTLRQAAIPQIMKGQVSGEEENSLNLVYKISRYSFLFMLIPAVPLIVCVEGMLNIWLGVPPVYTAIFIILMLLNGMLSNLAAGFDATIQATGRIRKNQIGYCLINLSLLPIIYVLYKLGFPPYSNAIVMCFLTILTVLFQCYIMNEVSSFKISKYVRETILPSGFTSIVIFVPLLLFYHYFNSSVKFTILGIVISVVWTVVVIFFLGLNLMEKNLIISFVKNKIK